MPEQWNSGTSNPTPPAQQNTTPSKKPIWKRPWFIAVAVVIGLSAIAGNLPKDEDTTQPPTAELPSSANSVIESVAPSELSLKESVTAVVEKTRAEIIRVDDTDGHIGLYLKASGNLTKGLTKSSLLLDTSKILEELQGDVRIQSISFTWYMTLVDRYGNENDGIAMTIEFQKETIDKINFENFLADNIPNIADSYHEHPTVFK